MKFENCFGGINWHDIKIIWYNINNYLLMQFTDFVSLRPTPYAGEDSNNSRFVFTYYVHFYQLFFTLCQLCVYILSTFCLHFRMSSRRSSSEERDGQNADSYISDNFSTLSVSTSNIPNHFTNRMSQYSPRYIYF